MSRDFDLIELEGDFSFAYIMISAEPEELFIRSSIIFSMVPDIQVDAKKSAALIVIENTIRKVRNFFSKTFFKANLNIIPKFSPPRQ